MCSNVTQRGLSIPARILGICMAGFVALYAPASMASEWKSALAEAYTQNPELESQRRSLEAAAEDVNAAFSAFRPTLAASASMGRVKQNVDNSGATYGKSNTRQIQLEQPIFDGLSDYHGYKAAKAAMYAEQASLTSVEQNLLVQAATAYVDVIKTREVLALSIKNEEVLGKHLKATNERFDVGEVTRTDVAQSEARLARAKAEQLQAEADARIAEAEYVRIVRKAPPAEPVLADVPVIELPLAMEEAIKIAMEENPSLKQRAFLQESAQNTASAQKGTILPSVDLTGSLSKSDSLSRFGNNEVDSGQVLVNVTVPLYQSGSEYAAIRKSKRQYEQSKFDYRDAYNRTEELLIQSWEQLEASRATIEANEAAVTAAQTALDGVVQEQLYGSRTTLDVLDAEQELFETEVNLATARRNEAVARFNLASLLGQFTAKSLGLDVAYYNDSEYYDDHAHQILGY